MEYTLSKNEIVNKEIAKFAISYLKNRMMINQKLISMGEKQIDFETFMTEYSEYTKRLDFIEDHPESKTKIVERDGKTLSLFEEITSLKNRFALNNADFVVLTENQIDEMLGYVKESIEKYGINRTDSYYNETFFIRESLSQLANKMMEEHTQVVTEKIKRVKQFLSYVYARKDIGFCNKIAGHISNYDNEFCIATHEREVVCCINQDGVNIASSNALDNEDILIADKMYIGQLTNQENTVCVFLEKIVNGQRKMKAISYNQEVYDISNEKNGTGKVISFTKAKLYDNLNVFFKKRGFDFLASNLYTKDTLLNTIDAYNALNHMSPEERMEIENIIEVATSWWIDVATKKEVSGIQKFKTILGNQIRILLLSQFCCYLAVDRESDGLLEIAKRESQFRGSFPWPIYMEITKDKIEVKKGSLDREEIYIRTKANNRPKN